MVDDEKISLIINNFSIECLRACSNTSGTAFRDSICHPTANGNVDFHTNLYCSTNYPTISHTK